MLISRGWKERAKLLKERALKEEEFNQEHLKSTEGQPVRFDVPLHIVHVESGQYWDVLHFNNSENHFQVRLTKTITWSSIFYFQSIHKMRNGSPIVQITDQIKIFHEKSRMFVSLEAIIDKTGRLGLPHNHSAGEERTIFDYDLACLTPEHKYQVALMTSPDAWSVSLKKKYDFNEGNLVLTNTLVRIHFPNYDSYLCADHPYEGEHENVYADSYRGETVEEKVKVKYLWSMKTVNFGEFPISVGSLDDNIKTGHFFLQHFLTGKVISKNSRSPTQMYLSHKAATAITCYLEPATSSCYQIVQDEPFYLHFTERTASSIDHLLATVEPHKQYSREQLNTKFESSMSRKSRREYFKPLLDEDGRDLKYVDSRCNSRPSAPCSRRRTRRTTV